MPFGESGKFSIQPQQAKMHDQSKKQDSPNETHGAGAPHEPAHMIEVHHPQGAMNPSPGKHHTVTHHADGNMEHKDHEDMESVHKHMDEHWEGGMLKPSDEEDQQGKEFEAPTMGKVKQADSGGY